MRGSNCFARAVDLVHRLPWWLSVSPDKQIPITIGFNEVGNEVDLAITTTFVPTR